jgi:hypothetical protein
MPKLLREQEFRFRLNSFIIPGLIKTKALYYPIWLILLKKGEGKGDPGGWNSIIIMPNYGY